jgi:hypothetical protein
MKALLHKNEDSASCIFIQCLYGRNIHLGGVKYVKTFHAIRINAHAQCL